MGSTASGPLALPADAGHVHGIVRAPGGEWLVGTHAGVFEISAGDAPRRVGDAADYMGLAALPSGVLLSSGHPAPDSTEPNPLGLRQSSDGGASWSVVTQMPRDDYHVIEAGGGRVYAVGSDGALYAGSAPTRMTPVGPAPAALVDIAVEPGDGRSLLAATQAGLRRSTDGGRRWAAAGQRVGLISWAAPAALFLVDAEGRVWLSSDRGRTWTARGALGAPPAALLAASATELVAADHDGRILTSSDGARTWS